MLNQPHSPTLTSMTSVASQSKDSIAARRDPRRRRVHVSFWSVVPLFMMTFTAFVLLALITFSLPFLPGLYFLRASQAGGVRFGIWGWCLEAGSICSEKLGMGYTWEPEVAIPITKALALYPIAAISVFLTLIAFIEVLRAKSERPIRILAALAWTSFALAFLVFSFMIVMWSVADDRFNDAGWETHWGPLPWMSFMAAVVLLIVALHTWKGALALSTLSSSPYQGRRRSAGGWSTTAEKDQRFDADSEKGLNSPRYGSASRLNNDVAVPSRPYGTKKDFEHHGSSRTSEDLSRTGSRQDSLLATKKPMARTIKFVDTPHPKTDITIDRPPKALHRDSQKKYHLQLTPLRT